ncbi:glucosamine-6-phosphate deaminase [Mucisphaera calidilacus]|uniref:Glucosamine-6-phosphate deaminase 1 n=1 Tax=Mucisphaera calidilacus TaxID=2527982 RepID=A0A518BU03_9BACT|nr:glucosamine-6-phosphate deaminase [Mucisphaera calidilacus]QDU70458.1 Glucosamine-6-phosphate deaminase 1 [Mucisphaera calidilacus]
MKVLIREDREKLGREAAAHGASLIRTALRVRGEAAIIVATGASQFATLEALVGSADLDWSRVTVFHLDEYLGLPITHPASFRLYLWDRFLRQLPVPVRAFYAIDGNADPLAETERLGRALAEHRIDVAFVGIGENAHLAFNDPPADFDTDRAFMVVALDEACRQQQLGEGWFATLDDVPRRAITMSVPAIMGSEHIICTVPDERKAQAVAAAVEGPVTEAVPASILQLHPDCQLYLDQPAASRLTGAQAG